MLQKLYAMAAGRVREDNPDSLVNQEVLLPGHLWEMILTLTLTLTLPLTLTRCASSIWARRWWTASTT